MRATTKTTIAGLVATGGLALAFASPAQAAVPSDLCAPGATFVVDTGEGIDPALATSVHDALTARGLTAAAEDDADLTAVIAPASEVVDGGDASVMAVALAVGELDPATAIRDTDWAPVLWSDGATPVNALLDTSCGTVDAVTDSAESSARTTVPA
uniref:hypothetical protein n=1 Tax=Janibacter limosus TaxID=53458 RepID=UPI000A44B900